MAEEIDDVPAPSTQDSEEPPPITGSEAPSKPFPIVGIGASAGGLAAFEAFFSAMPADTEPGMAFVLVQHLSPDHKSILTELIKRFTRMPVEEVEDGVVVQPNRVYIIPPSRDMAFLNGTLQLLEPSAPRGLRLPIDFFFRSLALDQRERAICVVLSGSGSDGSQGVRAIKAEGGLVVVQTPDTTEYDGMPQSAVATGLVDYVLPAAEIPARLIAYVNHAFLRERPRVVPAHHAEANVIKKICVVLRDRTGHDFSKYKQNTLVRRVQRRMAIHQIDAPEGYLHYLQKNAPEADALFRDLLIGVTSFFRDPDAFEALRKQWIPALFAGKPPGGTVRVWVCGCSTGEEAYSIAILLQEHLDALKRAYKVQVFATDIDPLAIEKARAGVYPTNIAADVAPERLSRFFVQDADGGAYRIQKSIRDLLVFSEQDVLKDPPFSKLDLICCRNLLIYLNAELQKQLIPLFHYALNRAGLLFLGTSETVGDALPLFEVVERKHKVYRKKEGGIRPALADLVPRIALESRPRPHPTGDDVVNFRGLTEQTLLQHNEQAGVLVTARGEILYIFGRTGSYLEPAPGNMTSNIVPMARPGLRRELTTALHLAVTRGELAHYQGIEVGTNGDRILVDLTVRPVLGAADLFLVILEQAPAPSESVGQEAEADASGVDSRLAALEHELRAKDEYLQTTLEEMETANEELRSTNEEMQSVNEELQSTNEELETSKEELQSVNEELSTVNAELQNKVIDLSQANNDMNNLLAGTGIATLFVDLQLRIARFTPTVTKVINLIRADVGRPVAHFVSNLDGYNGLAEDIQAVMDSLTAREVEVRTTAGATYLMRIQPYRTLENAIEGAVITFVGISELVRLRTALATQRETLCSEIVATVREPLLVLDGSFRVVMANRAFCETFKLSRKETEGRLLFELGQGQWDIPELHRLLEDILPRKTFFDNYEVTRELDHLGRCTMVLNARCIASENATEHILLAIELSTASAVEREGQ